MRDKIRRYSPVIAVLMAALALMGVIATLGPGSLVEAAPAAAPTPASTGMALTDNTKYPVYFWYQDVITQSGRGTVYQLPDFEILDIHYDLDVTDGSINTTTLKLQYTNFADLTNWVDGVDVAASVATDTVALNQYYNFGRYTAIYATVANTNPVTITVIAVAK